MSKPTPVSLSEKREDSSVAQNFTDKIIPVDDELEHLLSEVTSRTPGWFGQSGRAVVTLLGIDDRPQSTLISVSAELAGKHRKILIKSPKVVTFDPQCHDRLLLPVSDPLVKSKLEYETLTAIARHFDLLEDPRFGCIQVYAHLQHPPATIVEWIAAPTFDKMLRRPDLAISGYDPLTVFRNLGGWLAEFHQISMPELEERDAYAFKVIEGVLKLVDIIFKSKTWPRLPTGVDEFIRQRASYLLPGKLPLGLVHGDFAPRNVFIGSGSRVTVIDSLGRYRAPIYEDIAYLLVELLSGAMRLKRHGFISAVQLASMRAELLSGYGIVDDATLSVFELRALLDKWRSLAQRSRPNNLRGCAARLTDSLRRFIVSRRVNTIIKQLGPAKR
jgi:hypothetical protein